MLDCARARSFTETWPYTTHKTRAGLSRSPLRRGAASGGQRRNIARRAHEDDALEVGSIEQLRTGGSVGWYPRRLVLGGDDQPPVSREGRGAPGGTDAQQSTSQIEQYARIGIAIVDEARERRPRDPATAHDLYPDLVAVNPLPQRTPSGSCADRPADHFFQRRSGPGEQPYRGRDRHHRGRAPRQALGESRSQPSENSHHAAIEPQARGLRPGSAQTPGLRGRHLDSNPLACNDEISVARSCAVLESCTKVPGDRQDRGTLPLARVAHRLEKIRTGPRSRNRSAHLQR